MAQKNVDARASRKVELAVGELEALSVPPCVAVQYLPKILEGRFSPGSLAEIAQCEPVVAAEMLSLAQRVSAGPASQRHSLRLVLDRLDADEVRDTLLSTKVTAGFEIEFAAEQPAVPARKDLTLHSLAVAIAAGRIAQDSPLRIDPDMAYSAGLLHDIGKFALQQVMPRSLAAIAREAETAQSSLYEVERRQIGTDHALLGKHLARRWRLPEAVGLAAWLHHGDAAVLLHTIPNAGAALLVRAADAIARQAGVGHSGSYETPEPLDSIARTVGVPVETLQQIQEQLPQQVEEKSRVLGFDVPHATARYCDLIQASAARLSRMHARLMREGRDSQMTSSYLNLAGEFLRGVGPNVGAIDMAEDFARRWQRFFQTGSVCLYWPAQDGPGAAEAVLVEALGHSRKIVLEVPPGKAAIPQPIASRFTLMDARNHIDWLLEQVEVDFDPGRTKLAPLLCEGQAVAVLAFEMNYPGDAGFFAEKFETASSMAAAVVGLALAKQQQERLLEQLALTCPAAEPRRPAVAEPRDPEPQSMPALSLEALAEMAAGAAHELNNPLSVIAGRAQLLAQAESDGQKRHVLDIIGENAREAAVIVEDLMSFAQPETPRPTRTDIRQIIEEALHLAARKTEVDHINVQIQVADDAGQVLVDSGQVVSALANVIANSVEAYADALGPVKITAKPAGGAVRLQISDLGNGMDVETLRKATHPFFSAKPAGRKRGMGLAYADRFIRLNRGALAIESRPDHGTTVTITLPRA
jgi:putative nucleotidyltransferase with HDIG domain